MDHQKKTVGQRFDDERTRLGLGVQETAVVCGVTRHAIGNIFRGAMPSGSVLQGFAKAGADIGYVLLGKCTGMIDLQLLGLAEAELRAAYGRHRPQIKIVAPIRTRASATIYNQAITGLRSSSDVSALLAEAAEMWVMSMDDPTAPELLESQLFATQSVEVPVTGINVSGSGNRVAGRDLVSGSKRSTKPSAKR